MYEHSDPQSLAITDAVIVQPDGVIEFGAVGVRQGRIVEIAPDGRLDGDYEDAIDARGAYLIPGIIDVHNDSLETEVNPRPDTNLPIDAALSNLERRLLFSGVTTEFHAVSFMNNARNHRSVAAAAERTARIAAYAASGANLIDHNVLHRLDVWSPDTLDTLFESLDAQTVRYVSINDHTPGQGQYRDLDNYKERMVAWVAQRGGRMSPEEAMQRVTDRAADSETVPMVYARILAERERRHFHIASHDDDSPEKVDTLSLLGARLTEFPVTLETAQRARERGMTIVVGAPNVVRGGSSSGNMDAAELFSAGLADVMCADYHAPSLLPAAFRLVDDGLVDLPAAVRTLGYNAARALGRADAGAVLPGYVADLVLISRFGRDLPLVETVIKDGRQVLKLSPARRVEVRA